VATAVMERGRGVEEAGTGKGRVVFGADIEEGRLAVASRLCRARLIFRVTSGPCW